MIIKRENWNNYLGKDILLEVYGRSRDSNSFLLGYMVIDIDQYYIFKSIDEYGLIDGYVLYLKNEIEKIECDDKYIKTIGFNIDYLKKRNLFDQLNLKHIYDQIPKDSIISILEYCRDNHFYVTLTQTKDDYVETGEIISVDSQKIAVDEKTYCKDFEIADEIRNTPIYIKDILTLEIVNKENFLYKQYLKQK
ncbi:hypothetical protein [Lactobacillus xylocopicola]|uniref:Uncharacterized protein n=1 Tax=Lactobacillus xylocopicola TaxID=2976676 RepID=A0ABN6SMN7_9LACO|nr:hypothetical protein [Lactobacillus xylocopicola]BDR60346.1 hypothetical protein KIM322_06070 [Lactobacillus xylocopicola]